ncbi:MAG: hypothetical protein H7246_11755, partial [Phycisphaerae bacterium]|nr:hypothetical protein [Saprospiraceae bacterium]
SADADKVSAEAQANFSKVSTEAQADFSNKTITYSTVELVKVLPTLERLGLLFDKIGLDAEDALHFKNPDHPALIIQLLAGNPPSDGNNIKVIRQLATYTRFKQQAGDATGIKAYRDLLNITKNTQIAAHSPLIATILGCGTNQVTAAANLLQAQVNPSLPFTPSLLRQIEAMVQVFSKLGIYEPSVLNAFKDNTYAAALLYENALRTAFRAQYTTEAAYEKAWDPYENRIQELRRDVLCAFLLALDQQNHFHDTGDLYAYFLVDVEMSGCSRVSRILAATLSLQLYIHRVIMGLELTEDMTPNDGVNNTVQAFLGKPDINPELDTQAMYRKQWEWRKNYRVWEANRKVFLYPENWIEPELRHDKSPLFKTLEDELLQQKISLESAEQAYIQYLKGFAEVGQLVIAGMYYEDDPITPIYHIFGRTATDPYQYYYRKMRLLPMNTTTKIRSKQWTAWEKVELAIAAPYVSPIMHNGKVLLFWVNVVTMEKSKFNKGDSEPDGFEHTVSLSYSNLMENGKWLQPQKVQGDGFGRPWKDNGSESAEFEQSSIWLRVYPFHDMLDNLIVEYCREEEEFFSIDLFQNYSSILEIYASILEIYASHSTPSDKIIFFDKLPSRKLGVFNTISDLQLTDGTLEYISNCKNDKIENIDAPIYYLLDLSSDKERGSEIRLVFNKVGDYILRNNTHQYLLRMAESGEIVKGVFGAFPNSIGNQSLSERESILLTTNVIDGLTIKLAEKGLVGFLSLDTQRTEELHDTLTYLNTSKLYPPFFETKNLDFSGAHGLYFRELFFHIPFLIADHLNAEGKYKEADYWYRKIFDPSASFDPDPQGDPKDRYWQFMEFRAQTFPNLWEILTDAAAISAYEDNPFNPHAIAQVRSGPYQKTIVMKYVDNLIDWGDSLFRRDTWESNTEAMLLYQLAHDILGERPQKTGPCESAIDTNNCGCIDPKTTYAKLKGAPNQPFVYSVENWVANPDPSIFSGTAAVLSGGNVIGYEDTLETAQAMGTRSMNTTREMREPSYAADFGGHLFTQNVFCIPGNEKIFDYWDRVADRQYKLRHCMNIDGVKRSLALFQPPIDPALLVAAFAAGLSVEDVLNSLYGDLPAYRFSYLVEKAKAFAGTVQSFGGALLSALEKKDSEALTLLRSTQEQNILKMTKDVKKKAIEEAKANLQSTVEGMVNTMNRVTQYTEWIEENLNGWEAKQQKAIQKGSDFQIASGVLRLTGAVLHLLPQLGAFTALKWGGKELGDSANSAAGYLDILASIQNAISSSAGLEASFQRRAQDWKFQLKTAEQELKQVQQQIAAATIRLAIAEKDLEIHEKQIEQAADVHDFYKHKFTGLGLYNYMAKRLNTLHRMAFNVAIDMAKQAEAAYKFETGEETYFEISGGTFWDASRVGLLSGESLTLELQKLETNFINWNHRQMEIRQSFSMRMIDPESLLALRKNGICPSFSIPEWAFDMQYPGHYRRRIVSVQITIPCVAGPYHNIAATLAMTKGSIRKTESLTDITDVFPFRGSSMIATSNANNDGGQFELNFRDERFLPFEGAGAVDSEWVLELPDKFRSFDYDTISDVIFHVSYRSRYDGGLFKTTVLTGLKAKMESNNGIGLNRLVSLKEEFPDVYYQLQLPIDVSGKVSAQVTVTKNLLPYFAQNGAISSVKLKNSLTNLWQVPQTGSIFVDIGNGNYRIDLAAAPSGDVYLLIAFTI